MKYQDNELIIRSITDDDLTKLWELIYKEESPEWKKLDAPYFEHKHVPYEEFLSNKKKYVDQDSRWAIEVNGVVIGIVSYYWEHKPSQWLEMGIGIYDPKFWSGGYGTRALRLWISHLFHTMPLVRVGYTTWSGNERMIKVGEKLGMTMEARLRKCRYYNGEYYDSIRMGLLREEWESTVGKPHKMRPAKKYFSESLVFTVRVLLFITRSLNSGEFSLKPLLVSLKPFLVSRKPGNVSLKRHGLSRKGLSFSLQKGNFTCK